MNQTSASLLNQLINGLLDAELAWQPWTAPFVNIVRALINAYIADPANQAKHDARCNDSAEVPVIVNGLFADVIESTSDALQRIQLKAVQRGVNSCLADIYPTGG